MITETAVVAPAPVESSEALAAGFPIVGAFTGRLAAFDAFFSGMPAGVDQNMSFVLVQHLT